MYRKYSFRIRYELLFKYFFGFRFHASVTLSSLSFSLLSKQLHKYEFHYLIDALNTAKLCTGIPQTEHLWTPFLESNDSDLHEGHYYHVYFLYWCDSMFSSSVSTTISVLGTCIEGNNDAPLE